MEEVLSKQASMAKAAKDLEKYKDDPKKLIEKAAEVSKMGRELEAAGKRLQEQFNPKGNGGEQRVVLTPDQRERLAETGVAQEVLVVQDPDGSFARAMPGTQKATIERLAARQAGALATKKEVNKATEKLLKQLKSLGVPELEPVIEAIEADPTLEKLKEQQAEFAKEMKQKHAQDG